jgi:hypothetical protein
MKYHKKFRSLTVTVRSTETGYDEIAQKVQSRFHSYRCRHSDLNFVLYFIIPGFSRYRYRHSDLNFLWYFIIPGFRATVNVTVTWTFCGISSYPVSELRTVTVSDLNFLWHFIIPGFRATVTVTVTCTFCGISSYPGSELPLPSQWPALFVVFHHTPAQSYRYRHSAKVQVTVTLTVALNPSMVKYHKKFRSLWR